MSATRSRPESEHDKAAAATYPTTPDGRYFVVRGRLWRKANPALDPATLNKLVRDLMKARRQIAAARSNGDADAQARARKLVHATKVKLGERGPVWWSAREADHNRRMVSNTPYADWYASLAH